MGFEETVVTGVTVVAGVVCKVFCTGCTGRAIVDESVIWVTGFVFVTILLSNEMLFVDEPVFSQAANRKLLIMAADNVFLITNCFYV